MLGTEFYSCPSRHSFVHEDGEGHQFALHEMTHGKVANLQGYRDISDEVLHNPNAQIISKFVSTREVGEKRKNLFSKKLFYQNQLSSLKEKGKRLMLCEKIDQEISLKKQEFLKEAECEDQKQNSGRTVTFAVKKEAVDRLESAYEKFNSLSLNHQEENIHNLRQQLMKRLGRAKSFDAKTQFINNKIEYDQRFFNHGYSEQ